MAKVTKTEVVQKIVTVEFKDNEFNILIKLLGNMTPNIAKSLDLTDKEDEFLTNLWKELKRSN